MQLTPVTASSPGSESRLAWARRKAAVGAEAVRPWDPEPSPVRGSLRRTLGRSPAGAPGSSRPLARWRSREATFPGSLCLRRRRGLREPPGGCWSERSTTGAAQSRSGAPCPRRPGDPTSPARPLPTRSEPAWVATVSLGGLDLGRPEGVGVPRGCGKETGKVLVVSENHPSVFQASGPFISLLSCIVR